MVGVRLDRGGQACTAKEVADVDVLLLKVPEAANQLGISRAKLYELIADGTIPAVKIGGCRRIRMDDLHDYVAKLPSGEPPAQAPRVYDTETLPLW